MPKYLITRTYKHIEELEIEADSKDQALELAEDMEFDRNHDDLLYDERVEEI